MFMVVKLVTAVRLLPTPEQEKALRATLDLCNAAANQVSQVAYEQDIRSKQTLQRRTYGTLKGIGLTAQPATRDPRRPEGRRRLCDAEGEPAGR
jgi:hypothetical protein